MTEKYLCRTSGPNGRSTPQEAFHLATSRGLYKALDAEIAELRPRVRAHDDYLAATRRMAQEQERVLAIEDDDPLVRAYRRGWLDSLSQFCRFVAEGNRE
jgi:hypothetical protein